MALSAGFMMWRSNLISSSTAYREISTASSSDVEAIKDVLHAQQQLLTKLYGELDEERELSSSAADEAMSMILRLQAEKSQLKMEASQYKREAEEKMCLAEESLAIFEDLVDQKEAEIAYLEFQVKFYKDKLLDMGYTDVNIPEYEYSDLYDDNNSVTESEHHHLHHHHHRHSNPILNNATRRRSVEIKKCHIPLVTKKVGASGGDLNSHWEHIKKLDEQVKKISHNRMSRSAENTNSKNRPFRSSSVPPPDIQDSMAVSPPKHAVLAKMDLPNIPKCPVPINV